MGPRLDVKAGPLAGDSFSLAAEETSIGREPSNQIAVLDSSLSRRHCLILRRQDQWVLRDLGSRNGTQVNGSSVAEHVLVDGDEVRVGSSLFVFRTGPPELITASDIELDDDAAGATVILRREDSRYLGDWETAGGSSSERLTRDLNVLVRFSQSVNTVRTLDELQRHILNAVFDVSPAGRAAILLVNEKTREIESITGRDRKTLATQRIPISRTIVRQVLDQGVSILAGDVGAVAGLAAVESLVIPSVHSVIAVPIELFGKVLGVLYADSGRPDPRFDQNLLELLTAIGAISAVALDNTRRVEFLEGENRRLQAEFNVDHDMVGESAPMREVFQFIAKVAPADATVLITGESGTGKELVARAIHRNSGRSGKPFMAINCAAITETLLESEMFGHEKGAFTGATQQKKGKLEAAEGGTVFLDEVGELASGLQAKMLRVLQEREFERVGGTRSIRLDVRLIAATNRDLREMVRKGLFREDLYYRLNVVSLRMPPLRERKDDILNLATHFARRSAAKVGKRIAGLAPETQERILAYDWPGNIRELENAVERAVVLGSGEWILPDDLPEAVLEAASTATMAAPGFAVGSGDNLHDSVRETKRQKVLAALEQAGGNYAEAARIVGVHPNYFYRLVKNLGIRK